MKMSFYISSHILDTPGNRYALLNTSPDNKKSAIFSIKSISTQSSNIYFSPVSEYYRVIKPNDIEDTLNQFKSIEGKVFQPDGNKTKANERNSVEQFQEAYLS